MRYVLPSFLAFIVLLHVFSDFALAQTVRLSCPGIVTHDNPEFGKHFVRETTDTILIDFNVGLVVHWPPMSRPPSFPLKENDYLAMTITSGYKGDELQDRRIIASSVDPTNVGRHVKSLILDKQTLEAVVTVISGDTYTKDTGQDQQYIYLTTYRLSCVRGLDD